MTMSSKSALPAGKKIPARSRMCSVWNTLAFGFIIFTFIAVIPAPLFSADTLNVIIIVAHPDEAEEYAGGTAALLAADGHRVKFLSVTNGDVGHWKMTKQELADRRKKEALEAGRILGATYEIFPYHDGELENSVELRKRVVRAIREWKADLVISIKPAFGGGHPDEMASGIAVQQGAGLSSAPLFMPEIPAGWETTIELLITDDLIDRDILERHIEEAGNLIGLGSFTPKNGGIYGRFQLESLEWFD